MLRARLPSGPVTSRWAERILSSVMDDANPGPQQLEGAVWEDLAPAVSDALQRAAWLCTRKSTVNF